MSYIDSKLELFKLLSVVILSLNSIKVKKYAVLSHWGGENPTVNLVIMLIKYSMSVLVNFTYFFKIVAVVSW
jgi:hypothetical protein